VEALLFLLLVVTLFQFTQSEQFNKESDNTTSSDIIPMNSPTEFKVADHSLKSGFPISSQIASIDLQKGTYRLSNKNEVITNIETIKNSIVSIPGVIDLRSNTNRTNLSGYL
jgi:hypothetical protein